MDYAPVSQFLCRFFQRHFFCCVSAKRKTKMVWKRKTHQTYGRAHWQPWYSRVNVSSISHSHIRIRIHFFIIFAHCFTAGGFVFLVLCLLFMYIYIKYAYVDSWTISPSSKCIFSMRLSLCVALCLWQTQICVGVKDTLPFCWLDLRHVNIKCAYFVRLFGGNGIWVAFAASWINEWRWRFSSFSVSWQISASKQKGA